MLFRVVIVIGVAYGKYYPIMLKGRDSNNHLYYECIIEGEEDTKIIRNDQILGGTQPSKCRKWRYNRGSVMNPAMILMPGELSIWGSGKP
ncbi:MAG TPA: hypothetical protein DCX03_01610 [Bacteroidales bacterium]|nr:hypothetical protein [Bacteroidales bacterium]